MIVKDEIWKRIPGFEDYEVSNKGRIKSYKSPKSTLLSGAISKHGYVNIHIRRNVYKYFGTKHYNEDIVRQIGYFVLLAFIGQKPEGRNITVSHIDGNSKNNNLNNLMWESMKDNMKRAFKNHVYKDPKKIKEPKLTNDDIFLIIEMRKMWITWKIIYGLYGSSKYYIDKYSQC